jgi:hypothetical protein
MSSTYTVTETGPRELAGKIASDLRQFSLHYGQPPSSEIRDYLDEIEALLRKGYLHTYAFGIRRGQEWVMSYEYTITRGQLTGGRPGGIEPNCDVTGAAYLNFLTYSDDWRRLSDAERAAFRSGLKIKRTPMEEPSYSGGYWTVDRSYGAGGTEVTRRLFKR